MRKLCDQPFDLGTCQRLPHEGDEHMLVEYRAIRHHPFEQVRDNFAKKVGEGGLALQAWTCDGCGAIQRMSQINGFYTEGQCENCGHVTNLVRKGCNFTLMLPLGGAQRADLKQLLAEAGYTLPHDN